jgi:hypothetical protein
MASERHNDLTRFSPAMQDAIVRACEDTTRRHRGPEWQPCVRRGHACYRCQDVAGQALTPTD